MAVEWKNYVQDLKDKDWLQNTVDKEKIGDDFDFANFDKEMEQHFNQFLENHKNEYTENTKKKTLQLAFNDWLDTELIKLDTFKDREIEKAIIGPTTFELQKFDTATELWIFEWKVKEEKDQTKKTEKITITWDDLKIDLFKDSSGDIVDKDDIVELFAENNFENKDKLLNLLKSWGKENVEKFQRIIAEIAADGSQDDTVKWDGKVLWRFGVDWKFGWKTLEAFRKYVEKHKIETTQSEQTNEAIVTEDQEKTQDPTASNPENNDWQGTYKATAEFTAIQTPAAPKWSPVEKPTEDPNKKAIDEFQHNNNKLETLNKEKATEIVKKAKELNQDTLQFSILKTLTPEVAKILSGFKWELYLTWLKELSDDVLNEFINGECTKVHFKWGQLLKNDDKISIHITDEKTYSKDKITNDVLTKLINWNSIPWNTWGSETKKTWTRSSKTTSTTTSTSVTKTTTTKRESTKTEWKKAIQEQNEYTWNWIDIRDSINKEFKTIGITNSPIKVIADLDDTNTKHFSIPKKLSNIKSLTILYNPELKNYIKTVDGDENAFAIPTNIKFWLIKGIPNTFIIWDYEKKDWFLPLNENSNLTGVPNKYPWTENPSFRVTELSLTEWNEETLEQEKKAEKESKNEYKNLENNKYWEVSAEVVDSNYDALIDYMEREKNENLIQAFQRLEINPNSIANTLAQVLAENPEVTKFERKHISNEAMKQLGRNKKLFVNEKNNIVKILNNVERGKLQQFINEMKVFNDIRELQKTKKFVEMNKEKIKKNSFLILSDFGKDWTVDTWEKWIKHHWRTSEQAMYDVFVSLANTDVLTEKRENGQSYKVIIDWPKTADLVKWFVSLIKTVWEDRYNDIESEFNWEYTMNKLWEYIVTHQETLVLYQQTINSLSYNSSMDIQDLVSDSKRKSIVDGKIQEIKEISTNRDEVNKRFESQLWKNEEFDKWFKALSTQEQKNFVWNMAVWLDEWWILPTIVKTFWIDSKTWVTVDNLDAVDIDFNFFKDDAWIWPRIALIGPLQGGLGFHLDIPIANLTANFDLNHRAVENSVIHGANPVHQLYTRLWANVGWWIVVGWKTDEKLSAYFSAAIEWALWWKADYKKWIELNARNFGNNVLQNGIFKDPDFTTKENFKEKAKKSIEDILNWTDKENKNLRKFMKSNKQEMDNCVENVSNLLDVMWAFGSDKKPEHKKILLDSIMKWIVEEVKNQNLWELDWKTKLTRLWIFGQVWWGFDQRQIKNIKSFADFKKVLGFGWSVWLEATLSAWNMIYWPDKEKYNYMDAQLKNWESIKPIGEWIKTNNIENMKNAIAQSLSENSIPNIEVKSNDKNQIEISVTDAVLQKYGKKNIYELFNIYVNPEKKDNVAISEDGKTLTMGWNNLENFSVATRRYFDDFAVYLMIWWKWIDGCGNNKINDETVWEYNTTSHANTVPGFEFTENDTTSQTEQEKTESIWDLFESYNELDDIFTDIEKKLSLMDNWNYWAYAAFMNAAAELGVDKSLDTSDYDTAFENLKNLLKWKLKDDCFVWLRSKLENSNITDEEKVMIVDRFKAIFSYNDKLFNEHNLWLQLNWRWDKYRNLHWYDKSADFPLSQNVDYRGKIQKQLNAKWIFERKPNPNLIGMTAFYRLGDKNAWRSYMMTELGWTNVLGWETIEITDDLEKTKDWFIANLEKSVSHKEILKASLRGKIKSLFDFDVWTISDDNLKSLLMWEDVDIWNKKIKINVKYVFYLLWECGNESIWVELWDITIKEKTNPDNPNPDNPEDNVLEVWIDGQTLTKTESLNQDDVSAKVNILGGNFDKKQPDPEPNDDPRSEPNGWEPWDSPRSTPWSWDWWWNGWWGGWSGWWWDWWPIGGGGWLD